MKVRGLLMVTVALIGLATACTKSEGTRDVILGVSPTSPPLGARLTAPAVVSPVSDIQLDSYRPTLVVNNGTSDSAGTRTYEFQISDVSTFATTVVTKTGVAEGTGGTTSFTPDTDLPGSTRFYWRARMAQSGTVTDFSATAQFRTKVGGYNRAGELFDPLIDGTTVGTRTGSTTFQGTRGLQVNDNTSYVRYVLASTLTSGFISVEVQGLAPDRPSEKARIFSMMDGGSSLFSSNFLFNVQYRGIPGNPNNAISYKVLMGDPLLKYEPDFGQRSAGVRSLNPNTVYFWQASWGSSFQLTIREGGATGTIIYDRTQATPGAYNPTPHTVYLGANDAASESGSYAGAIYRNLWVGSTARPAALGSALLPGR